MNEFMADPVRLEAVLFNLFVIGEAVKNIPDEVQARHPQIDWRRIAGLRNVIAHVYFAIDLEQIWSILTKNVPELKRHIQAVIESEADRRG
jgi:uncharacterized protein with HEPN domain